MNDLKALWHEITARYTDDDQLIDGLWIEIEKQHTDKNRHYHNLTHLTYMIRKAIDYKNYLTDIDTVLFAILYHDIIYRPNRRDNEQRSAAIAHNRLTRLGLPDDKILKCYKQVLATKDHQANSDSDTNYFLDFDLAILGEAWQIYQDYIKKIRQEYSIYPNFIYKKGRKNVIQHFLSMDSIFKTRDFYERYERQARDNLKTELQIL